jgi:two-component system response regulator YesN
MELYQNPAIKSIMMTGDREWSGNYSHAVSHTKSVLTANAFINSIYYFNNNEIVLNVTNKTESHDAQEKLFNLVKSNNISVNPTIWELDLMNGGSVHTMTVFFHEGVSAGRNMDYAVAINIDLVELKSNIFADEDASGKSVFIIDRDGNTAMQWGNSIDLDEEHIGRVILSEKPYQMFKSTIDDRYVNIHHLEVEDGKLFIVSVMDYSQSISELIKARNVLLLSSVLIILVTILISIIISHIIYKPLGNIFENIRRYITHPVMKTRGIDEVQLISNTLSGMVERINSLERVNEQNMIVKMIISDDAARDDELDVIERAVLMEKNAVYAVIVLRIDEFDALKEKYNREAIAFQMSSILTMSADFLSEIAHTRAFQVSEDTIALFVSRPADSVLKPDSIIDSLGKLQGTLQRMLKISVTCGVSPVSDKVNQIVDKYRSAYALTKYRLFYGSGHVFGSRFIDTLKNTDIPSSYTDDLVEAVKKSEFNKYEHSCP